MAESVDLTKVTLTDLPTKIDVQAAPAIYQSKPAALAIALGVTVESIDKILLHAGDEIIDSDAKDDTKFRGFTVQEMVDICLLLGFAVVEVDRVLDDNAPANYDREASANHRRKLVEWDRFEQEMKKSQGLAIYRKANQDDPLEHTLAFYGDGTNVTFVDPENEVKFTYKDQGDLWDRGIELISLLCISKVS